MTPVLDRNPMLLDERFIPAVSPNLPYPEFFTPSKEAMG